MKKLGNSRKNSKEKTEEQGCSHGKDFSNSRATLSELSSTSVREEGEDGMREPDRPGKSPRIMIVLIRVSHDY